MNGHGEGKIDLVAAGCDAAEANPQKVHLMSDKSTQSERRDLAGSNSTTTYQPTSPSRSGPRRQRTLFGGATGACSQGNSRRGRPSGHVPTTARANSPWAGDPLGLEPPLGFSVDGTEPTGEVHEIQASLATTPAVVALEGSEVAALAEVASCPSSVAEPAPIRSRRSN